MQWFKKNFSDVNYFGTTSTLQTCLRLNDLDEIGDGTHHLVFHMLGLFSFREWSVPKTIQFWLDWLEKENIYPDYITLHPDKMKEWSIFYPSSMEKREDIGCLWSDGEIGGYSTEFYKNNVEIGNIVNPLGSCIDVGFGFERLLSQKYQLPVKNSVEVLQDTCLILKDSGIQIGHNNHGYIFKKLLTRLMMEGGELDILEFKNMKQKMVQNFLNYSREKLKPRNQGKTQDYWMNTYGIDESKILVYEKLFG